MWNLAAEGLREYQVAILRELMTRYDLDGVQIDFSRHVPCLPAGRQWELREHVTGFMRMVRGMLLRDNGLAEIFPDVWPLALFMLITVSVAVWFYRETLE